MKRSVAFVPLDAHVSTCLGVVTYLNVNNYGMTSLILRFCFIVGIIKGIQNNFQTKSIFHPKNSRSFLRASSAASSIIVV